MRDGWTKTTLGDIAEYINGYPFKPDDLGDNGIPVIRIKQLLDATEEVDRTNIEIPDKCVLMDGDIVFSWSGTLAVRVWNRGKAFLNQHLFRVIEKPGVSHDWLPLVIDHAIEELVEKSHGTTMKHITKQTLLPHEVLLPPLEEQKRIVDVVSSVDAYIDALQQQADTARTARNAVLHELLDSVSSAPQKKLKDLTSKIGSGATPRGGEAVYQESGVSLIRSQNVHNGRFLHEGLVSISDSAATALDGVTVEDNDVLVNITGASVARACMVDSDILPARVNQHVAILRADSNQLLPSFLLQILLGKKMNSYLLDISGSGTTRQAITKAQLEDLEVSVPPLDEQKRIVEIVSTMDDVIQSTEQAATDAKNLRAGLLSDLLSGEHEVPESYDKLMGAA